MVTARILYRFQQFRRTLTAHPAAQSLALSCRILTPSQMALFNRLAPSEQAHSLAVLEKLLAQGESHPDLQVAALLHDVGKTLSPLKLWERVLIVLAKAIAPGRVALWGRGDPTGDTPPRGWRRPYIVAEQHPAWGARLAAQAGASPLAQALIRRHHQAASAETGSEETRLLHILQIADNDS